MKINLKSQDLLEKVSPEINNLDHNSSSCSSCMQVPLMCSSSLQLGNNFVVLGSIFTIKGDAKTHRITVEYGSANFVKEISVTVKPEAFKVALAYCRDKIAEERRCGGGGYWNSDWEVTAVIPAPAPVVPTPAPAPAPADTKKEEVIITANPPEHIFVGNQVCTFDDDLNHWIVAKIQKIDLERQTAEIVHGSQKFFTTTLFTKILPVRQNRDQLEPDWRDKKVLYLPKMYEFTLVEGTIVADVPPNVVIITTGAEAEIVPFSKVYVVL